MKSNKNHRKARAKSSTAHPMHILVFNAGSQSLKWKVFRHDQKTGETEIAGGMIDKIQQSKNRKKSKKGQKNYSSHEKAFAKVVAELQKKKAGGKNLLMRINAVAHRVVHGGKRYAKPTRITKPVLQEIQKLSSLAPLHNPVNLAVIRTAQKHFKKIPHIAIFDTAFHRTIPDIAKLYALPIALQKKFGIERYGFHGTSHEYISEQAIKMLAKNARHSAQKPRNIIICHLGNGASITAVQNGKSIETSMGFTPLEGIPMGTRSGNIDPAIPFFLAKKGMPLKKIEHLLTHKSGLLGLSGISSDMRVLRKLAKKKGASAKKKRAQFAMDMFSYAIAKTVASYVSVLGSLQALVFTGGIGEHAGYVRKSVCQKLKFLGPFKVLIIPTNEELHMARKTAALLKKGR